MIEEYKKELKKQGELYLSLRIRPSASLSKFREIMADGAVKIDISAPAENNKANKELLKFLSKEFVVSVDNIKILSGVGERTKLVKIIK